MKKIGPAVYILNFLAFFAISMVNTQMIPYLSKVGYGVMERGYILAANSVVAIGGQLLFGYLCDRYRKIRRFFGIAYVLLLASSIAMFLVQQEMFFYHLFTVALMGGMVKVIMGLDETWMLELDQQNYGKLRAAGAMGLTIGSPIAGYLIRQFSYMSLVYSISGISILLFFCLKKSPDAKRVGDERVDFKSLGLLLKNKAYILLVTIFLLVYMIGTADQYVVIDKMLAIGANNAQVGFKWALQSFMEVPLFLGASWILKKFKNYTLLIFGTVMYSLKFVCYGLSFHPWMVIATTTLQLVTLPIIMLTSKVLVNEITPKKLQSSAQMFAMAIFIGVSGLITPLITSFLCDHIGYDWTLYTVAIFGIVPFLLILWYKHMDKSDYQQTK